MKKYGLTHKPDPKINICDLAKSKSMASSSEDGFVLDDVK